MIPENSGGWGHVPPGPPFYVGPVRPYWTQIFPMGSFTNYVKNNGGSGGRKMSTLLNKPYIVNVLTRGRRGTKRAEKSVNVLCKQPLSLL